MHTVWTPSVFGWTRPSGSSSGSRALCQTWRVVLAMGVLSRLEGAATRVDGVFSADPEVDPDAEIFEQLTYMEVLEKGLRVMDSTAITMCMENDLPIRVFNINVPGNIARAVRGEPIGTLVR